jgi:SAM-dependent methyltransferase
MKETLLEWLRCPDCGQRLSLESQTRDADEVMEGNLRCPCGKEFPIQRGVPRFAAVDAGVENFSYQWLRHRTTQLDSAGRTESTDTFARKTGLAGDLAGRLVLDVGVGTGRFADVAHRAGAEVVGVDLSFAVESAFQNIGRRPGVHIVQADLFRLPFGAGTFDVVYSIGVLHHTPDCRRAFHAAAAATKSGGVLAVWVYHAYHGNPGAIRLYRALARRVPLRALYLLSHLAVPVYYLYKVPVLRGLLAQLTPTISLHPDWRWRVLDTFDWYGPRYQSHHTYDEVYGWYREAGFHDIQVLPDPVSFRGQR